MLFRLLLHLPMKRWARHLCLTSQNFLVRSPFGRLSGNVSSQTEINLCFKIVCCDKTSNVSQVQTSIYLFFHTVSCVSCDKTSDVSRVKTTISLCFHTVSCDTTYKNKSDDPFVLQMKEGYHFYLVFYMYCLIPGQKKPGKPFATLTENFKTLQNVEINIKN